MASYTVKQSDLPGDIINTATATGRDPCGKPVDDLDIVVVKTAINDGKFLQYGQLSDALKVSGSGLIDLGASMIDKDIALDYHNIMNGKGDIELNQEHAYSQNAEKLKRTSPL